VEGGRRRSELPDFILRQSPAPRRRNRRLSLGAEAYCIARSFVCWPTVHELVMGRRVDRRQLASRFWLASRVLGQCAASCEDGLQEYVSRFGLSTEHQLFRELIPAIATIRTAADLLQGNGGHELVLHLAHEACSRAATECRRYGLDESLLRCAAACDQAVTETELLLTALVHDERAG
jgi:hypothetical protein